MSLDRSAERSILFRKSNPRLSVNGSSPPFSAEDEVVEPEADKAVTLA
jgi:hypothetical protein